MRETPTCPECGTPGEVVGHTAKGAASYRCPACGLCWAARGRPPAEAPPRTRRADTRLSDEDVAVLKRAAKVASTDPERCTVSAILRTGGIAEARRILADGGAE